MLAERTADTSPHRRGEPYRLAVSGIYARLSATAIKLKADTLRPPYGAAPPYAAPPNLVLYSTDVPLADGE